MLLFSSQIFPRGLSFFISNPTILKWFGRCRYIIFFILLAAPMLYVARLAYRIKVKAKEDDDIDI
jgi:multisubunit Na+/H+ antiporter MnhG subunit